MQVTTTHAAWLHAVAVQNRLFLGAALTFTSIAAAVTWAERARRRDLVPSGRWLHSLGLRARWLPPGPVLAPVAAAGATGLIVCALLIIGRVDAYNGDAIYLRTGQPVRAMLAPGDYVVFVGCTEGMVCPQLPPRAFSATISDDAATVADGGTLNVIRDPSPDHLSENAQPFVGELSFSVPERKTVRLEVGPRLGQPAFVVPSPGEEAHALGGWIALAVLSLAALVGALVGLGLLLTWRLGFGVPAASLPSAGRPCD